MTSALRWGWVVSTTPRPLYPREIPGTHCTGGWVGPRAGLEGCGKSRPPPGFDTPDRPVRSESLYRLSYHGPYILQYLAESKKGNGSKNGKGCHRQTVHYPVFHRLPKRDKITVTAEEQEQRHVPTVRSRKLNTRNFIIRTVFVIL